MNVYFKEISLWILSVIIAAVLWYPVFSKLPYFHLYIGMMQIILMIQICRWFIYYERTIFFTSTLYKGLLILFLFIFVAYYSVSGIDDLRIFENQSIEDITYLGYRTTLHPVRIYHLFDYLRTLVMVCVFFTGAAASMLVLKIVYRSVGMGSTKAKKYLG